MAAIHARINTFLLVLALLALGAIIAMLASRAAGGPLDPPGAPAETDGVRLPGTPIDALPFLVDEPGHYYLTRSVSLPPGSMQTGITIAASNVTLDLNGFSMSGDSDAESAIEVTGSRLNIVVRNGIVENNWGDANLTAAVDLSNANGFVAEDLVISFNTRDGLELGVNGVAQRIVAVSNGGDGIAGGHANVIRENQLVSNIGDGIDVGNENLIYHNRSSHHAGTNDAGYRFDHSNVVHDNVSLGNAIGYDVVLVFNTLYRNTYLGTGLDVSIALPASNDVRPFEAADVATNPWANIRH